MLRKLTILLLVVSLFCPSVFGQTVTDPESFFGFKLGSDFKLADWPQLVDYFKLIDGQSERILVEELGKSTQGNPFILAIITSENNMPKLGEYRALSRKLSMAKGIAPDQVDQLTVDGKVVVLITCSIHASEVGAAQATPEIAYDLITLKDSRAQQILENVIFLLVPSFNPD